jgi:hypothetical protein
MARRLDPKHAQVTRDKIKTSQLVNRLTAFAFGECEMNAAQVTAALGVLRKTLPDLASQELTIDHVQPFALLPAVMPDSKDWETAFQPGKPETEH